MTPSHRPKRLIPNGCCPESTQPVNNLQAASFVLDKYRESLVIRSAKVYFSTAARHPADMPIPRDVPIWLNSPGLPRRAWNALA